MRIENNMDETEVKNAVKLWSVKADGYDGAIGGIFGVIPWPKELESVISWDNVEEWFSNVIPQCPEFNLHKIICGDCDEINKMNILAEEVTRKVAEVYAEIIRQSNCKISKRCDIRFVSCIVNGHCQYIFEKTIYGDTWHDVIEKLHGWTTINTDIKWSFPMFADICYESIHNSMQVNLGSGGGHNYSAVFHTGTEETNLNNK